jgi:multiple sugar transport system permease protein
MAQAELRGGQTPPTRVRLSERESGRRLAGTNSFAPYLFLLPFMLLFTTFILFPAVWGLFISLFDWDFLLPGKPFVGLENYTDLFSTSSRFGSQFWQSMRATGLFTLLSVPLLVTIPLGIAVVLNQKLRGQRVFRAIYFMPYALGIAVVGVLFRYIFDPNVGLINYYLGVLGLPDDIAWTTSLPAGWGTLVSVTVWWLLGFNAIIYLAGLQDIPRDLYDAAEVDGANRWQTFRYVTIPGLKPVLLFVITINVLLQGNMFGQSFLITQGAPGQETQTAIMYIGEQGLRQFQMGDAAAMSYVLAFFLIVIAIFNFKVLGRGDD